MSFDPSTAYKNDWRYQDFVEDADYYLTAETTLPAIKGLKVRREDISHPDFISLAAGLSVASTPTAFVVWNPTDHTFAPLKGGVLKTDDGVRWIILSLETSRFGHWLIAVDKAK